MFLLSSRIKGYSISLFASLLLSSAVLHAQATGRIGGTVTDASNAVVVGAKVVCTNQDTGLVRNAASNEVGVFEFPDLPIGRYRVDVTMQGFQPSRTDLTLVTGQSLNLGLSLKVGDVTQALDVTAEAPLVQAEASSVQTSVTETQMKDLPLNGRNPLQLTTLTPGTAITDVGTESGQQDNRGLTVNGLRATQNNFTLDGTNYTNRFFDSVPVMPNPDALQEFTVQSSNYSAEYGGAGALVQLSTRSGANAVHGTAYEFLRNTDLNARNFFTLQKPPFKLNQYGGTIGGPIIKNRTFFFFSGQDTLQRSAPSPISITTPTQAQRNGDFSSLLPKTVITDPFSSSNAPFAGNIIPLSRMDPVSVKVAAALLPLPNSGTQYISSASRNVDDTQYLVKIDHNLTQANRLSGRYFYDEDNFQRAFNAPNGFYASNLFKNQTATLNDTEVFSPTFTATSYFSFGRFTRTQIPVSPGLQNNQTFGANVPLGTAVPIFSGIRDNISGFVNIFSGGALKQNPTTFLYKASATKVWRAHQIGFGFDFERSRINISDYSYTPGDNTFNGQRSGYAVSDFFLGAASNFFQDNGRTAYLRESRPSMFVQDDWKVTRTITLNLGLRWEPWLPPTDLNSSLVGFVPGQQSTIAPHAPLGLVYPGDTGIQSGIFKKDWKDFAPRVGFAWNLFGKGKTVLRAGYGIFYSFPEGLLYQRTDATQPTDLYLNIPNPSAPYSNVYAGFAGGDPFPRPHILPSQFSTYNFLLPVSGGVLDPASRVGYTQNWNFTLEHQIGKDYGVSIAYVGNHGVNVMGSRQFNPALLAPGATVGNENSRRLYPGLAAVELASSYVYSEFNSLQLSANKRFSKGLTFLTNFVYSKTIDNTSSATEGNSGPPNPFNFASARGPADFNQKFRYNLSLNYVLPSFTQSKALGYAVNGWQYNVIGTYTSGFPITIISGTDRSLSGIGNDYADYTGISTTPVAGLSSIQQYFNTAAFAQAALGTFGNTGRGILTGPSFFDLDMSLFKDFRFTERWRLQFRAEGFNIQNRANFQLPTSQVSSGTFGRITGAYDPRVFQFAMKIFF
jgi:hypothetical protein